jgi:chromosome segregation ATPase
MSKKPYILNPTLNDIYNKIQRSDNIQKLKYNRKLRKEKEKKNFDNLSNKGKVLFLLISAQKLYRLSKNQSKIVYDRTSQITGLRNKAIKLIQDSEQLFKQLSNPIQQYFTRNVWIVYNTLPHFPINFESMIFLKSKQTYTQTKYDELKKKYDILNNNLKKCKTTIDQLKKERFEQYNRKITTAQLNAKYGATINQLKEQLKQYDETKNQLKTNYNELENKYNELKKKSNQFEPKYNESEQKYDELKKKYNILNNNLKKYKTTIDQLKKERFEQYNQKITTAQLDAKYGATINQLKEQLKQYDETKNQLKTNYNESEQKYDELENKYNKTKNQLETSYNKLKNKCDEVEKQYNNLKNKYNKLKKEYNETITQFKFKYNELQKKSTQFEPKYNKLKEEYEIFQNKYDRLKYNYQQNTQYVNAAEKIFNDFEKNKKELDKLKAIQNNLPKLKKKCKECEDTKNKLQQYVRTFEQYKNKCEKLTTKYQNMFNAKEDLKNKYEKLKKRALNINTLKQQNRIKNNQYELEIQDFKKDIKKYKTNEKKIKNKLSILQKNKDKIMHKYDITNDNLKYQNAKLQKIISKQTKKINAHHKEIEKYKNAIRDTEKEYNNQNFVINKLMEIIKYVQKKYPGIIDNTDISELMFHTLRQEKFFPTP